MFGNHRFGPTVTALVVRHSHRIIDDRIEKSVKRRQIEQCAFAASIFKMQRLHQIV